jgi:hypothetical protein
LVFIGLPPAANAGQPLPDAEQAKTVTGRDRYLSGLGRKTLAVVFDSNLQSIALPGYMDIYFGCPGVFGHISNEFLQRFEHEDLNFFANFEWLAPLSGFDLEFVSSFSPLGQPLDGRHQAKFV